jgi:hypothetical protein
VYRRTKINLMESLVEAQASGTAAAAAAVAVALEGDPAVEVLPPRHAASHILLRHVKENVDGGMKGMCLISLVYIMQCRSVHYPD